MMHELTSLFASAILTCLFIACGGKISVHDTKDIVPVDIAQIEETVESYLYEGNYQFITMRSAYGSRILTVDADTAWFDRSTNIFCIEGSAIHGLKKIPLEGARVFIGTFKPIDILRKHDSSMTPQHARHKVFVIEPYYEYSVDAHGKFNICTKIEPEFYLIVASKGDLFQLYNVGKLVDSTMKR